jgi:hypothetical protein
MLGLFVFKPCSNRLAQLMPCNIVLVEYLKCDSAGSSARFQRYLIRFEIDIFDVHINLADIHPDHF